MFKCLFRIALLSATLCAFLVLYSCDSCRKQPQGVPPAGDSVTLSPRFFVGTKAETKSEEEHTFTKFSGNYPASWPSFLTLPEGSYVEESGEIMEAGPKPGQTASWQVEYIAAGVVQGEQESVNQWFQDRLSPDRFTITYTTAEDFTAVPNSQNGIYEIKLSLTPMYVGDKWAYYKIYVHMK